MTTGVTHNISLLRDILSEPNFQAGNINTNYLSEIYPDGFHGKPLSEANQENLAALVAMIHAKLQLRHWDNINTDETIMEVMPDQWRCHVSQGESQLPCHVFRTLEKNFKVSTRTTRV